MTDHINSIAARMQVLEQQLLSLSVNLTSLAASAQVMLEDLKWNRAALAGLQQLNADTSCQAQSPCAAVSGCSEPLAADPATPVDEFELIKGIDPDTAAALASLRITSFSQLAELNSDRVIAIELRLDAPRRVSKENWIEQAAILSSGRATAYSRGKRILDVPLAAPITNDTETAGPDAGAALDKLLAVDDIPSWASSEESVNVLPSADDMRERDTAILELALSLRVAPHFVPANLPALDDAVDQPDIAKAEAGLTELATTEAVAPAGIDATLRDKARHGYIATGNVVALASRRRSRYAMAGRAAAAAAAVLAVSLIPVAGLPTSSFHSSLVARLKNLAACDTNSITTDPDCALLTWLSL